MAAGQAGKMNRLIRRLGRGESAWPLGEGRGGRLEIKFNHVAYDSLCNEIAVKTWDTWSLGAPPGWWSYIRGLGRWRVLRTQKLHVWDLPRAPLMCLFIWLVLICTVYNKTIIGSRAFSWVLWVIPVNYGSWGDRRNPQICSRVAWELWSFAAGIWGEVAWWGTVPSTCEMWTHSGI